MLTALSTLLPIYLLIALGFILRRVLLTKDAEWVCIELLVYYVLFPALLICSLARADLGTVPVFDVAGSLMGAILLMSALCLAIKPLLARYLDVSDPSFTSVFQGATRWHTFVALSLAGGMAGSAGITIASVAMVAMIPLLNVLSVGVLAHYASPQRLSWISIGQAVARNPLIWACVIGIVLNLIGLPIPKPVYEFGDSLGRCSLALGLLVVGAGLRADGLRQSGAVAAITVILKLTMMPLLAVGIATALGLSGTALAVVAYCAAVPTASNGYILARQMGGDANLFAQIFTLQTVVAAFTLPLIVALVG